MTALLLTGGEGPSRARVEPYLTEVGFAVAADSGLDLALGLGVEPDLIVGDMDSLADPALLASYEGRVLRSPRDKDETDTEIGLRLLAERGYGRVIVAGGGGGRLAHLMGMLAIFERPSPPALWLTAREHVQPVESTLALSGCEGETISFFPLGSGAEIRSSSGLKWPLDGLRWERGDVGISNVAIADVVEVELASGRLLMVREW